MPGTMTSSLAMPAPFLLRLLCLLSFVLLLTVVTVRPVAAADITVCATGCDHTTIQDAIDAAVAGDRILVDPGTYVENITINKDVTLVSTGGRAVTTIQGTTDGSLGTILVTGSTTAVQIGDTGEGFTIIGIDNPSPGIESAAIYFQGSHSGAVIRDNEIEANGDLAILTEWAHTYSGFVIDGNEISGQTFNDPEPGGDDVDDDQFTEPNVPRPLVYTGNGAGGLGDARVTNLTFTNNTITGTAGGVNAFGEQGRSLIVLHAANSTVTGNTFQGSTNNGRPSLRVGRPGTTISGNTFDSTNLANSAAHLQVENLALDAALIAANIFDKDVTIVGAGSASTIVEAGFDTPSGVDGGWFQVNDGIEFNLSGVTLDGDGQNVWSAIRSEGTGTIRDNIIRNIRHSIYVGLGVELRGGSMLIENNVFENIQRIGVFVAQPESAGTVVNANTFTGKGDGDHLDYGVEVGRGGQATITNNVITGNTGVAASDGSTSAGILVTTYYAPGTAATITNNVITGNTDGIVVGYDENDTSAVTAEFNNLSGNAESALFSTNPLVDAENNWWGDPTGPQHTSNPAGLGDEVSDSVDFDAWLCDGTDTDPAIGFQPDLAAQRCTAAPDRLVFATQPGGALAGQPLSPQPVVEVQDGAGNLGINYSGSVDMSIANNPGFGTLGGTVSQPVTAGVATFTNLAVNNDGAGYTLKAEAAGLADAVSSAFDVGAQAAPPSATGLAFAAQPGGALAGQPLSPQPVVEVRDANGQVVTSYNGVVIIGLGPGAPGGAALQGTTIVFAQDGVATFSDLAIDTPGTYTLVASVGGLPSATSDPFDVTQPLPGPSGTEQVFMPVMYREAD